MNNDNRYIINIGNIPPKEKVIFKSKFIHYIEYYQKYGFELFRNLPIFQGKLRYSIYDNSNLKGTIIIKANHEILNVEKNIMMNNLIITNEKYLDEEKKNYYINYEINDLPKFTDNNLNDDIPCSKIYFELKIDYPIIYTQESSIDSEINYYIKYKNVNKETKLNNNNIENYPALFIFLIDQSSSMYGTPIKLVSNALKLFLQSLPEGSYFQLIGFGSYHVKYQEEPKEYAKENILEALKKIEKLDAGLGETIIYKPLYEIFKSYDIYKKINLPINIFLLIDGEINDKPKVIDIIEKNNEKFKIYSIGMGNKFDEDLIKAAGSIGKGTYSFCKDLKFLNSIVIKGLINAATSFVTGFELENNLDDKNILKNCSYNSIIKDEELICEQYILSKEDADKMKDIKINIKYTDNKKNEIKKEYNIIPEKIPKGDELSKLIVYDYIRKKNFSFIEGDKKIKLALKYQLLIESTSLYAEIELSNKINKEMKIQILGNPNKIELKKDISFLLSQGSSVRFRKLRMHESDNEDENSDDDWDDCIKGNKNCDIKNKGEVNLEKEIIDKKNCNNEIIKKEEEIVDKNISNINKKDYLLKKI